MKLGNSILKQHFQCCTLFDRLIIQIWEILCSRPYTPKNNFRIVWSPQRHKIKQLTARSS